MLKQRLYQCECRHEPVPLETGSLYKTPTLGISPQYEVPWGQEWDRFLKHLWKPCVWEGKKFFKKPKKVFCVLLPKATIDLLKNKNINCYLKSWCSKQYSNTFTTVQQSAYVDTQHRILNFLKLDSLYWP